MRAALRTASLSLGVLLVCSAPALAAEATKHDNGEGFLGETTDKAVTFFSLGVVLFLALFVTLASLVQGRLERRKEEKKAAKLRQRVGW